MSAVRTASRALALARRELGYVAPKSGSKFGKAYGIPKGAWCAMFVSEILKAAGLEPGKDFPMHAWTPSGVAWGKDNRRWTTNKPRRGDLVYFMWSSVSPGGRGTPPVCHVGFVEAVNSDGSLTTIEGNTSGTVGGSQYNGGTVQRKIRRANVVGYVRPRYQSESTGAGRLKLTGRLDAPTIRALQRLAGTPVDGSINGLGTAPGPRGRGRVVGNRKHSPLIEALQDWVGSAGKHDGKTDTPRSPWIRALQRKLRMVTVDGFLSYPRSATILKIQRMINAGTLRIK